MKNFTLAMVVVFLVLCVPWFCVAQAAPVSTGYIQFNDLTYEQQLGVFSHCTTQERARAVVNACEDDLFPRKCWSVKHKMCLEGWR